MDTCSPPLPAWWPGDYVDLKASVESMVDAGVHGFKPYVHSDCGGDYSGSAGDLIRWTAHCALGSITRFHGSDHRPWRFGPEVEATIRGYLEMRYTLLPSLIAAGRRATSDGTPLAQRCDLLWPHLRQARSNSQYIWLQDILVAPIYDSTSNYSSRDVWIPPGEWQDAWNGSVIVGPTTATVTKPFEHIPLWHRVGGGLVLTLLHPGLRVEEGDWTQIGLLAFPEMEARMTVSRTLYERGSGASTQVRMRSEGDGSRLTFEIDRAEDGASREYAHYASRHAAQYIS